MSAYKPGDLAKVGQVWILESLAEGELKTGRRLREDLLDYFVAHPMDVPITYKIFNSADELLLLLDELEANIRVSRRSAILDIECHGDQDMAGLILADGSFMPWELLKPRLEAINIASRFNLILVLGCCYGGYFGRTTRLRERSAFCAYLAPRDTLSSQILADGLLVFFKALFAERDAAGAINALVTEVPDFPYYFATAYDLFRKGLALYIRDLATGKPLRDRAKSVIQKMRDQRRPRLPKAGDIMQFMKSREPIEFEESRRIYFAIDLIPENDERYRLTYDDIKRDAENLRRVR